MLCFILVGASKHAAPNIINGNFVDGINSLPESVKFYKDKSSWNCKFLKS